MADNNSEVRKTCNGMKNGFNKDNSNGRNYLFPAVFPLQYLWQNRWALWFSQNDRSLSWEDNQKIISSFNTIEEFWRLIGGMRSASLLRQGYDYSMFRSGIRPMWEDSANERGGRWILYLGVKHRFCDLDRYWLDIMLCLLEEGFKFSHEICGAVVSIRYGGDKIAIWTANANDETAVMAIGHLFKERLGLPPYVPLYYQTHKDAIEVNGIMAYQL